MFLFKNFFYCLLTFCFNNMREVAQLVEQSFFYWPLLANPVPIYSMGTMGYRFESGLPA